MYLGSYFIVPLTQNSPTLIQKEVNSEKKERNEHPVKCEFQNSPVSTVVDSVHHSRSEGCISTASTSGIVETAEKASSKKKLRVRFSIDPSAFVQLKRLVLNKPKLFRKIGM